MSAWIVASVAFVSALAFARLRWRNWRARPDERSLSLLGDDLIPDPAGVNTRAVTVKALAKDVWSWLIQIGQGRGGMYSYDWLENLVGLDFHSAHGDPP